MPDRSAILAVSEGIARDAFWLAVAWHVLVGASLLYLFLRRRIRTRTAATLLMAPIASVSLVSLTHDSPFNGLLLLFVAAIGAALALRLPDGLTSGGPRWARALGGLLVVLAWTYPHFSTGRGWTASLYGAPMGVLPCPTLALVVGLTLVGGTLRARAFSTFVGIAGAFYGVYGVLKLGVAIDMGLVAGAAALVVLAWLPGDDRRG